MNKSRLLFTLIAFASLTPGLGYADEPARPVPQEEHKISVHPADSAPGKPASEKIEPTDAKPSQPKDDQLTGPAHSKPAAGKTDATNRKAPDLKADGHASAKGSQAGPIGLQTKTTPLNKPPQSAWKTAAPAGKARPARGGPLVNKTGNPPVPAARAPFCAATPATAPVGVRNRGVTAALVGASLGVTPKNAPAVRLSANPRLNP
jgi:hypothetical protein